MQNKLWISYSALSDFDKCKRAYYYKHIYRNPKNNNRIQVVSPYLSLGIVVHNAIEGLSAFPPKKRKEISLVERFLFGWEECKGKKGGFISNKQEKEFKERGEKMIKRAEKSKLIKNKSLDMNGIFPKLNLFKDVELVGSIDWIEILPSGESHIVDFKTGKSEESSSSLQLPIYLLLARENFDKKLKKASYFYLDRDESPVTQEIGELGNYLEEIKEKASNIMKAVEKRDFSCSSGYKNCFHCREFDAIFSGEAEHVGFDQNMKKELYYLIKEDNVIERILDFLTEEEKEIFDRRLRKDAINDVPSEKIEKLKEKLKDNLSNKELKAFINKINAS